MFRMLDFYNDGYLHASDLVQAQQLNDELSDFGEELTKLSQYYINTYLESRGKIREADMINIHRYKDLLDDSGNNGESSKLQAKQKAKEMIKKQ